MAAFVVLAPLVNSLWLAWRMPRSTGIFAAMAGFAAFLLDSIQGLVTLKASNAVGRRRQELSQHAARLRRESMRELGVTLMRDGVTTLCSLGGVAAVLAWRVSAGELALLAALFLAREAFRPIEPEATIPVSPPQSPHPEPLRVSDLSRKRERQRALPSIDV